MRNYIMTALFAVAVVFGTSGCVTIGDTASNTNTNSNNDNSIDNSTSGSGQSSAGELTVTINGSTLTCEQSLNGTSIEAGSYIMSKLEYGSVVEVKDALGTQERYTVDFILVDADLGKSLACESEFRLTNGDTKTYRSQSITY